MRVISGFARGHKLLSPKGLATRPTADRIKEAVFSMINEYLLDAYFLDLFSGSGAIGIEALSRGATGAVFVDNSKDSIEIIEKNLIRTKLKSKALVLLDDCNAALDKLRNKGKYDIIFMDPPYDLNIVELLISNILKFGLLKDDGIIIVEQSDITPLIELPCLYISKIKEYKCTKIIFYKSN